MMIIASKAVSMIYRSLIVLCLGFSTASAQSDQTPDRPLLVEGKNTVYQRVITKSSLSVNAQPSDQSPVAARFAPFQPLYVFERRTGSVGMAATGEDAAVTQSGDATEWLLVGASVNAAPVGWLRDADTIDWKQNIVAAFTNPAGRKSQLLFESEARLRRVMEHEALGALQDQMLAEVAAGSIPADRGVVAAEPPVFVNIVDQLYLMPILDYAQDLHPLNYDDNLLMEVASIPLHSPEPVPEQIGAFDAGIVFVFDTTQSMEPYIARTQSALADVVRRMQGQEAAEKVNFGIVAFRDNPEAVEGLEYRTSTLLPLQRRTSQDRVLATIQAATNVARVGTPGFNEDSLAGVEDALDLTDWDMNGDDPIDARFIILVTDAGPKDARDPNARSQIGVGELQRAAQDNGVAIMTIHIKTPQGGSAQHSYAEARYRALSRFNDRTYYYGIEGGSPEAFEATARQVVTALSGVIRTRRDQDGEATEDLPPELVELGLAMRLAYLGRRAGAQAPDVIRGWVSEKAIEDPMRLAVEPRLLVTKNEMATMADLLSDLLTLGEQARGADDAAQFFVQVRDVVARMARDPNRLVDTGADTLGGALEFLEDLPYESQLMLTTQERWAASAMNRRQILDGMRQKLVQYRKWLHDATVWTPLTEGAPDGEYVFAMPFDVLP